MQQTDDRLAASVTCWGAGPMILINVTRLETFSGCMQKRCGSTMLDILTAKHSAESSLSSKSSRPSFWSTTKLTPNETAIGRHLGFEVCFSRVEFDGPNFTAAHHQDAGQREDT